ncbi:class I adenylate-forming enzyme family protein [Aquabacterium sp.]|uniref:class I adenylate-forming enzyme family protein n=1 Tax=Aquabacterium sp. TaxID=1872578 RepID=UPI00248773E2|nr:AMP-binding protein [Aquabacterium sp.]MDI1348154.1 AMP-binding protein [Aquabacterium sp.]
MLLHDFFQHSATHSPDHIALVSDGQRHSFGELLQRSRQLAAALQGLGLQRGDRVALFLDNRVEMAVAVWAVLQAGGAFMPINPLTKADKLAYMLNDARARVLITQDKLRGVWHAALAQNTSVDVAWVCGLQVADGQGVGSSNGRERALPAFMPNSDTGVTDVGLIDQDLAAIIYTSGSTGDPKGVMLSHLNMVSACTSVSTYLGLRADDTVLCALPLAFDYGLYQLLMCARVGATLVLERSFTFPVKVLEVMVRERVTVFPGVPTMFAMLMNLQTLPSFDLGHLRMITNTAAALSEAHIQRLRALFPQATLFSMYGLTECKRVTYLPPEQLDVRPTSVGRGMPNEEVWLVDEAGQRLPNGSTGELVVRGSNVMLGYWDKPEATAQRLQPGPAIGGQAGAPVLHTGDLFRTDSEGYLYFVARKDDIIKSRGEKVSPKEVENALYAIEGVFEAAVIGVPDDLLGQAVKAFVVCQPGVMLTEREVIRQCLARLESFMAPKHVEFVEALPKTDTGKIKKTGLA